VSHVVLFKTSAGHGHYLATVANDNRLALTNVEASLTEWTGTRNKTKQRTLEKQN
jgi:hypothetical protein